MNWGKNRMKLPVSSRLRATKLVSLQSHYTETGWESLASRREKHKLVLYYKMQNGMTPEYLSSLVPPTVGSTVRYVLRNEADLQTVPARSQQYFNSFLPIVTRIWNGLRKDKRNSPSIAAFKSKLTSKMKKSPAYYMYYSGPRLGQIHHTRLRLNCSSLHLHLFLKNITDNPQCECGAVEDTKHFFLTCYRFRNLRQELSNKISTFCQPTLDVILYGRANLSVKENK